METGAVSWTKLIIFRIIEDMDWLDIISPIPRLCGIKKYYNADYAGGQYSQSIINPWRIIYDFEIFIFATGTGKLIINRKEYICPSPYFIILPPRQKHISYCISKDIELYWAHFDWQKFNDVPTQTTFLPGKYNSELERPIPDFLPIEVIHGPVKDSIVFDLHTQMVALFKSESGRHRRIARAFFLRELLELLLPDKASASRDAGYAGAHLLEKTRACLDDLAKQPFNEMKAIKSALNDLGLSYYHQERLFKRAYGITPYQYINILRCERIKSSLKATSLSISKIADSLGFEDQAYFSRFFKKHSGLSPRSYRNQMAEL